MLVKKLSSLSKGKSKITLVKIIYSPLKGRKIGANKWINLEIAHSLHAVDALLSAGREQL